MTTCDLHSCKVTNTDAPKALAEQGYKHAINVMLMEADMLGEKKLTLAADSLETRDVWKGLMGANATRPQVHVGDEYVPQALEELAALRHIEGPAGKAANEVFNHAHSLLSEVFSINNKAVETLNTFMDAMIDITGNPEMPFSTCVAAFRELFKKVSAAPPFTTRFCI